MDTTRDVRARSLKILSSVSEERRRGQHQTLCPDRSINVMSLRQQDDHWNSHLRWTQEQQCRSSHFATRSSERWDRGIAMRTQLHFLPLMIQSLTLANNDSRWSLTKTARDPWLCRQLQLIDLGSVKMQDTPSYWTMVRTFWPRRREKSIGCGTRPQLRVGHEDHARILADERDDGIYEVVLVNHIVLLGLPAIRRGGSHPSAQNSSEPTQEEK